MVQARCVTPKVAMATSAIEFQAECLLRDGYVVLEGRYPPDAIADARNTIIENIDLLKNTRPNPGSGHLAGFHRYPRLEYLHRLVSTNDTALAVIKKATESDAIRSIGLSDITVNRSQHWHVDLLRGKYRHHVDPSICWGPDGGGLYKALLYLQSGNSLKTVPGGHKTPIALDSDYRSEPQDGTEVRPVEVKAGALVLMDVRLPHRGSTEEQLNSSRFLADPKILITTVLGAANKPLTKAMEIGNLERLLDWDAQYEKQEIGPRLASAGPVGTR